MSGLEARKRELLSVSEVNRKILEIELGQWEVHATRWQTRAETVQRWWRVASPLVRIFAPPKYSSVLSGVAQLFRFWK
jgi:hypothetical protein